MIYSKIYKKIVSELKAAGIKSAEIDARVLLEFATKKSREFLLAHPNYELSDEQINSLNKLAERRKTYEPIAYITGHKEFFGLNFVVTPDVLIPRPETELLVEQAIESIKSKVHLPEAAATLQAGKVESRLRILDLGTGSGNIIISIAKANSLRLAACGFFASDISAKALEVAKKNAKKHHAKIKFIQSDLFENIKGRFDLIVANLPYVPEDGSNNEEIKHEPQSAIFAADNGAVIIKKFLTDTKKYINDNGLILVEVDPRNAKEIKEYALKYYKSAEIVHDLANKYRLVKILT